MTSPYTDPILDLLRDGEPRTVAEIREGIDAPKGAGIEQCLRRLMWTLASLRDPRKLVVEVRNREKRYTLVSRDPRFPVEFAER